jgi:hypothetical protein
VLARTEAGEADVVLAPPSVDAHGFRMPPNA